MLLLERFLDFAQFIAFGHYLLHLDVLQGELVLQFGCLLLEDRLLGVELVFELLDCLLVGEFQIDSFGYQFLVLKLFVLKFVVDFDPLFLFLL